MLKTLNTLLAIRTSVAVNLFVYYIRKLPLLGRLITDRFYANLKLKKTLTAITIVFILLWGVVSKLLYVGLMAYWPVSALGSAQEDKLLLFLHIFVLLSFVVAGVSSATVLEPKREKYIAVKLMRMSASRYMKASLGYRYSMFFVAFVPALLVFAPRLGATVPQVVLLAASVTMWRIFTEYVHLKLFDKTGMVLVKNNLAVWLTIGLGYAAAYLPLLLHRAPGGERLLLGLPSALAVLALGLLAAVRLARYSGYREIVDAATKRDDPLLDIGRMVAEAQVADVRTREDDYISPAADGGKLHRNEGYAYLNALFFSRHRRLIYQPIYKRMALIGGLTAAGAAFVLLFRQLADGLHWGALFPYMPIVLYFLSTGERACRAMFYNCDLSLLRHSFYRNAAGRHFRIRLFRIAGLNLAVAAALGIGTTVVSAASGGTAWSAELLLLWIYALSLSVFFSVHHLFMYYIFQPYSTELNSKNPLYHVTNTLVSMICGLSIAVRAPAPAYAAAALVLALVYLCIALVLVPKLGRRTFRVK